MPLTIYSGYYNNKGAGTFPDNNREYLFSSFSRVHGLKLNKGNFQDLIEMSVVPDTEVASPKFQFRKKVGGPPTAVDIFKSVLKPSTNNLTFTIAPTDVAYVNTLRRVILTEVETIGFRSDILEDGTTGDVQVKKNSTPMSNEMLAHRIGLLPIHVPNPLEWKSDNYTFELNITNEGVNLMDVEAADITITQIREGEDPIKIPSTQMFHPDPVSKKTCLLAVLKSHIGTQEPESCHFTAKATIGIGRESARFIPVSQCSYQYTLDTDTDRRLEYFNNWLMTHKKIDPAELGEERKKELQREFGTMEVSRCFLINDQNEPYSFDFVVESIGPLNPTYIVARAIQVIQEKVIKYASVDVGDLPENVKVLPADARMKGFDFIFQGEDHTLGNLLQTWIDANLVDSGEATFVGYKVPHPLKDEMVLRIGVESGTEDEARKVLMKAARGISQMFKAWGENWATASGGAVSQSVGSAFKARRGVA
jgi:DNA-directed RNA polymerase subunit L